MILKAQKMSQIKLHLYHFKIKKVRIKIRKIRQKKTLDQEGHRPLENFNLLQVHKTVVSITKIKLVIFLVKLIAIKYFLEIKI